MQHTHCGTFQFMCYEFLDGLESEDIDIFKVDVWSVGIIFYYLLYNTFPWKGKSPF